MTDAQIEEQLARLERMNAELEESLRHFRAAARLAAEARKADTSAMALVFERWEHTLGNVAGELDALVKQRIATVDLLHAARAAGVWGGLNVRG